MRNSSDSIDADVFYQEAQQPDFPDEMLFQIGKENPDNEGTFSREGIADIVDMIEAFIMARLLGQWKKTGKPPKVLKMHLKMEWEHDPHIAEGSLPYVESLLWDGQIQIDSERRIPRDKRR